MGEKIILLKDAKPGSITAEAVMDTSGATLVREGVVLDANWIMRLTARKIQTIKIMCEDEVAGELTAELEQRMIASDGAVDAMFIDVISSPTMQAIAEVAKRFRREKLTRTPVK